MKTTRAFVLPLLILLFMGSVIYSYAPARTHLEAIDLYNYWAVPTAQRESGYKLGSPYRALPEYSAFLKEYVVRFPDDEELFRTSAFWLGSTERPKVRRNNSPLLYMAFGVLPGRFSTAVLLFRWTEVGLFLFGALVLGWLYGIRPALAALAGLGLLLTLVPAHLDLSFGNVNSLLFFSLAGLLGVDRLHRQESRVPHGILTGLIATVTAFLLLFKPLVLLPCLLLILSFAQRFTRAEGRIAIAAGSASLAIGLLGPAWFFGSWSVWLDWEQSLIGKQTFVYSSLAGNCSLVMILSEWTGAGPALLTAAIATIMTTTFLGVVRGGPDPLGDTGAACRGWIRARAVLADPAFLVSLGITVTLALSPLVWSHYYVLGLIPASWLCMRSARRRVGILTATLFVLASSEAVMYLAEASHYGNSYTLAQALSWIPLWVGILIHLAAWESPAAGERTEEDGEDILDL